MSLAKRFVEEPLAYDGSQICGQWALRTFGLEGDSLVCFVGSCQVAPERMADLEDLLAGSRIAAERMLHFVIEHFACDLRLITTRQRLLAAIAAEQLRALAPGAKIERRGDDLYDSDAKLSISVAVPTRVSGKIHLGINVTNEGTPVRTGALADYGVEPFELGRAVADRYEQELAGIERALVMVRGVE